VQWFASVGMPLGIAEIVGVGLVVAAITYVSLIVGELVPKQIALRDPERIAVRVAPAMTVLAKIASPVVWLLDISGRLVLRTLGYGRQAEQRVTDDEIKTLIAEAETAGVIEPSERAMIAGVMRLGDRPVRAVMTPRRDVDMVDLSADPETVRRTILESVHSRLPAHDGAPDDMLGVLQAKDLLEAYLRGEPPGLRASVRPAPNVPDASLAGAGTRPLSSMPVRGIPSRGSCRPPLVGRAPLVVGEVLEIGTGRQLAAFLRQDDAIQLRFLIRRGQARAAHMGGVDRSAAARGFGEPLNLAACLRCDVTFFRHDDGGPLIATKARARCPCSPEALRDAQVPDAVRETAPQKRG
jgi:hypothetical protein